MVLVGEKCHLPRSTPLESMALYVYISTYYQGKSFPLNCKLFD